MQKFAFQSIMIIDDNEMDNWLAEILIKKVGLCDSISTFKTTQSAFDYLKAIDGTQGKLSLPDLIFLDLTLPSEDGFDFLEKYDKMNQYEIAIFILTASILASERDKAMRFKSVKGFVIKPLTEDVLREIHSTFEISKSN
ncbi:hypothetical protein CNR22_18640 [Sphingobacteriaceae bacterium]|nr:hypothetical protein CNR22_18640 [Sphingobacteriaceae bacterium]